MICNLVRGYYIVPTDCIDVNTAIATRLNKKEIGIVTNLKLVIKCFNYKTHIQIIHLIGGI